MEKDWIPVVDERDGIQVSVLSIAYPLLGLESILKPHAEFRSSATRAGSPS
jgi:hypothetical protein